MALKAGFLSLPKPENNFELLVPEDEEDVMDINGELLSEEDAAERDARLRRKQEEEERKALARRSQVVQLGLPRPANVDPDSLLSDLTSNADDDDVWQLVSSELVQLLRHDSIAHPIPGTSLPGGTVSHYQIPDDDAMDTARSEIHKELATSLGFPNANQEQIRDGLAALYKSEPKPDESTSWAGIRRKLAFDATSKTWLEPSKLSLETRITGYTALLNECRETMTREASKSSKSEKKLGVTLGGYQARSMVLAKRITNAFDELQKTKVDYESFSKLRINESIAGPRRVEALREEVEKLEQREKLLQGRYSELDMERRESEGRIAVLEEKIMAEAEALNDAAMEAAG